MKPPGGGGVFQEEGPTVTTFLLSLESAGSLEVEERVASPLRSKGKGRAQVQESDLGEVTGVICDLCDKKGVPCQWGKASSSCLLFLFAD